MQRRTFLSLAIGAATAGLARVPELSGQVVEPVHGLAHVAVYQKEGAPFWFHDVPLSVDGDGIGAMTDLTVSVFEPTEIIGAEMFLPFVAGDFSRVARAAFRFPPYPYQLVAGDSFTLTAPRIAISFD
jgi:hypothetical protein